jgi:acyl-CoA thioester hydrolase
MSGYRQDRIGSDFLFAVNFPTTGAIVKSTTRLLPMAVLNMSKLHDVLQLRVRYSETDQMGTFYNSRALEWFECGRTELMRRRLGMSYAELEAKNVFLPLVEAHLEFLGGARYDDLLDVASTVEMSGRAKLHFEVQINQNTNGKPVVHGHTIHAFAGAGGKPIRPPNWFLEMLEKAAGSPAIK